MVMLEVNINGDEVFIVDKEILFSSISVSNNFDNSSVTETTGNTKVVFNNFPGGPEGFELISRFCYSKGRILITASNTCILHCVSHFIKMSEVAFPSLNLINMTEKSLDGIANWSWTEIITALKQCQESFPIADSSKVLDKVVYSLVERIMTCSDTSPAGSSPESTVFRLSCDTRSTISTKQGSYRSWWFEDLAAFSAQMIEKVIEYMVSQKVDHVLISRFLFYYLKSGARSTSADKKRATEVVIDLLYGLDKSFISCKGLFGVLRVSSSLNLNNSYRRKIESMIGSHIDHASLDNLLIPALNGTDSLYDVNLILRFLKFFLRTSDQISICRLKQAASLMDLYLAEVAPDSLLQYSKFIELITALPDVARDSTDAIYRAIDMYLQVHIRLTEEEKIKICCSMNFEKLSGESCNHLAKNTKIPSRIALQVLISQQSKLRSLLGDCKNSNDDEVYLSKGKENKFESQEHIILRKNKRLFSTDNEKLKSQFQGMKGRVIELEKICKKMQIQMSTVMKTRNYLGGRRSLPRLCS